MVHTKTATEAKARSDATRAQIDHKSRCPLSPTHSTHICYLPILIAFYLRLTPGHAIPRHMSQSSSLIFQPVSVRPREDGWTVDRQRLFIETLADTGSVTEAAAAAQMSLASAYRLRRRPGAEDFAKAWTCAQYHAVQHLVDTAYERALYGTVHAVYHKGKQVGERRQHSDQLLMFLLRNSDPNMYGMVPRHLDGKIANFLKIAKAPFHSLLGKLVDMAPAKSAQRSKK
jgi:hypothetical protein